MTDSTHLPAESSESAAPQAGVDAVRADEAVSMNEQAPAVLDQDPDTVELRADRAVHGGVAIARLEGRIVLLSGAAIGETVKARLDKSAHPWRAETIEVLEPSADRRPHIWDSAAGGIELGYLTPKASRSWKTDVLRDAINHLGGDLADHLASREISPEVESVGGDGLGTRIRLDLDVDAEGRLAMHAPGSDELVPVTHMPLAVDAINDILANQDRWAGCYQPGDRVRLLAPTGQGPVVAVGKKVYKDPHTPTSNRVIERALGYTWKVAATGFWQTHIKAPLVLIPAVLGGVKLRREDRIAEFYGGAGLLTAPLQARGAAVRMWEGSAQAVRDAKDNVPDAEIHHANITPRQLAEGARGANVIVADPPRTGLRVAGAKALANSKAEAIALISCDPAAMARDVSAMVGAGRRVISIRAYDLFPYTQHLEAVTVLA
ncbi:MAG: class I SAM-dependent RNA methyltransferase [Flaviflexus sp.]|nr:class I SAM-dependent RNA methyltransferase [Flaviflexus sp.]